MSELDGHRYNEDYFERGVELRISGYQNYHWLPELTIPMAMTIIDFLDIRRNHEILDFGCAKGYLVKAFRLLYRRAWGIDISRYALENVDPMVRKFCYLRGQIKRSGDYALPYHFDFCIAKDVFEHIEEGKLGDDLQKLGCRIIFAIIPLGDGKECYVAPNNDVDITHEICQPAHWWHDFFEKHGWAVDDFRYKISGIKDHYYEKYPEAHGFFTLKANC